MAVQGPFKVECGELFPHGLGIISEVDSLDDFDKSTKDNRVQARDKDTGLPLWQVEVLDFDPQGAGEDVPGEDRGCGAAGAAGGASGAPVRPVVLEGLTVTPYIKDGHAAEDRLQPALHRPGCAGSPGRDQGGIAP